MKKQSDHIKKDDRVIVLSGKAKGKIGKVLKIIPKKNRAIVEKVNMVKRHTKAGPNVAKGGIIEKEGSLHISNLMLVCPKCADPMRVSRKHLEDGSRVRVCKNCGETLDE
ncbi:MAG: 50S ribosomal protein L24 [Deltaproteobacteria bacterium]|nr:50S ribosomal protein L24 [Deltaproteobacteria bacterium]MBW2051733.1 50S ribosomal protein L24 [Deltaproteobacteria bacterium]MBW2140272.1 50S ribosomal protein L24 [Deltaproteobacteria bacterium]MBW2322115.1 50S ribosomal protein L24 [Deltaproteobacteria bacterium]